MSAVGSSRRAAREQALALLYEADTKGVDPQEALSQHPSSLPGYTVDIVGGVSGRWGDIDELIERFSRGWEMARMPATDRAVLRMAVFELLEREDVPTAVLISEAVELAKRYSTEDSGRFVNGLLAAVASEIRAQSARG